MTIAPGIRRVATLAAGALALSLFTATAPASAAIGARPATRTAPADCAAVAVGRVSCAVLLSSSSAPMRPGAASAAAVPAGLAPVSLRYAYGLEYSALTGGVGQTVAVVMPFDDATAQADLATYRAEFSLPPCGSGCFSKVDQNGGTNYPPAVPGWAAGAAEALDMISAVCPNCHLLLVEATTEFADLGAAENTAVQLGAKFVVNAWLTPEATLTTGEPALDSQYFNHPGVVITAADGNGAGNGNTYYPAASPGVIAVGGTTLTRASGTVRGWTETVWSGTGSGCSAYEAKPSWQTDTGCGQRMLNDVSAVADPSSSGVAFVDTESGGPVSGGGGVVAASIVAAAYALAGTPAAGSSPASYLYAHHGAGLVADITSGSTGTCPGPAYYCDAGAGYDGPSGLGAPTSATALGAHAPSDSLTGGPAAHDPLDGALHVFGTGIANGTVWGDTWRSSGGWSGWGNMGGTLAGKPLSAVYDPVADTLEVYGLAVNGHVMQNWSSDGTQWSGWHDLGGTFAGAPSAVYDPLNGSMEVWEFASTGTAFENSWHTGSGWSGWQNRGGGFSGSLDAVYDPTDRTMRVFGVGAANGTVWGASWTPSDGFSGWGNMGGTLDGALSAIYNPIDHSLAVYGHGAASDNTQENFLTGAGWNGWHGLGGPSTSTRPFAVYDPLGATGGTIDVWEVATTGTAFENSWAPGTGWSGWQNRGGAIGGGLYPLYDPAGGSLRVFGVGKVNGTVWGGSWTPSGGFSGWGNMSGTLQTTDF